MAANGFPYRGHNNYYGSGTQPDEWIKTSYVSDHVCRPVLIDSEGRKRPIIAYPAATERCVTEKLEQCHSPMAMVSEYKHMQSSPTMADQMKDYGYVNDKWTGLSSPVRDRPPSVEVITTKIQTEAGRPDRLDILNASSWGQIHNSSPQPQLGANGYDGHHSDHSKKEWIRPIGNPNPNNNYDDYYYNKNHNTYSDPRMATPDGWGMTIRPTWTTTQTHESTLTPGTNNIGMAMNYLKEAAKPSSAPYPRYSAPFQTDPRRVGFTETIDSKEAARRYGKPNLGFQTTKTEKAYATTIDSREAARKYNGTRE